MNEYLDITQQCELADYRANSVMGNLKRNVTRRSSKVIVLCSAPDLPPAVLCSALGPPRKEGHGPIGMGQEKGL